MLAKRRRQIPSNPNQIISIGARLCEPHYFEIPSIPAFFTRLRVIDPRSAKAGNLQQPGKIVDVFDLAD